MGRTTPLFCLVLLVLLDFSVGDEKIPLESAMVFLEVGRIQLPATAVRWRNSFETDAIYYDYLRQKEQYFECLDRNLTYPKDEIMGMITKVDDNFLELYLLTESAENGETVQNAVSQESHERAKRSTLKRAKRGFFKVIPKLGKAFVTSAMIKQSAKITGSHMKKAAKNKVKKAALKAGVKLLEGGIEVATSQLADNFQEAEDGVEDVVVKGEGDESEEFDKYGLRKPSVTYSRFFETPRDEELLTAHNIEKVMAGPTQSIEGVTLRREVLTDIAFQAAFQAHQRQVGFLLEVAKAASKGKASKRMTENGALDDFLYSLDRHMVQEELTSVVHTASDLTKVCSARLLKIDGGFDVETTIPTSRSDSQMTLFDTRTIATPIFNHTQQFDFDLEDVVYLALSQGGSRDMLKGMRKEDLDRCIKVKPTSWFCPELDVVRRDHFRTVDRKGTSTEYCMYSIFKRDYKLAEDFCRFRPVPAEEINNVIQLSDNTFVARLDDETEVGVMRCHKNKTDLEVADGEILQVDEGCDFVSRRHFINGPWAGKANGMTVHVRKVVRDFTTRAGKSLMKKAKQLFTETDFDIAEILHHGGSLSIKGEKLTDVLMNKLADMALESGSKVATKFFEKYEHYGLFGLALLGIGIGIVFLVSIGVVFYLLYRRRSSGGANETPQGGGGGSNDDGGDDGGDNGPHTPVTMRSLVLSEEGRSEDMDKYYITASCQNLVGPSSSSSRV